MPATFDHTITASRDRDESARFFGDLLELGEAPSWGVFTNLQLDDGVLLQFAAPPVDIQIQHYAFLVDDALFDRAYRRLLDAGIEHRADPHMQRPEKPTPNTVGAASTSRTRPVTRSS
ncbi:VOC family protein [Rhodococcus zopfii]|uniref:VOC family protein n=1 Tax=Rhodococcus zopfii TaxID=43772 RepID=UPI003528F7A6